MAFKYLWLCLLAGVLLETGCTQPDYFEEEETTEQPSPDTPSVTTPENTIEWHDKEDKFIFNDDGSIRLSDPDKQAGQAFLTNQQTQIRTTCWYFHLKLSFNPSANNYMRIYLASSHEDVTQPLEGYFLQIGGEKDDIRLYRQAGTECTLLLKSPEWMRGDNSPEYTIQTTCDSQGHFTLEVTDVKNPTHTFMSMKQDETFTTSAYCVVQCIYTKSRSRNFWIYSSQRHHNVRDWEILEPVE